MPGDPEFPPGSRGARPDRFAARPGKDIAALPGGGLGAVGQRRRRLYRGQLAGQDIKQRSSGPIELEIAPGVQAEAPEWPKDSRRMEECMKRGNHPFRRFLRDQRPVEGRVELLDFDRRRWMRVVSRPAGPVARPSEGPLAASRARLDIDPLFNILWIEKRSLPRVPPRVEAEQGGDWLGRGPRRHRDGFFRGALRPGPGAGRICENARAGHGIEDVGIRAETVATIGGRAESGGVMSHRP